MFAKKLPLIILTLSIILSTGIHPVAANPALFRGRHNSLDPLNHSSQVSAYDLILAMNTLRVSLGNNALIEDPIINAVAQATAEIMAANNLTWHIGGVSERLQSAGFGAGSRVFATENFAMAYDWSIDQIMVAWADEQHMFPATNTNYCMVGAGVAQAANGMIYYVLQAAYVSGKSCGSYSSGNSSAPGTSGQPAQPGVSQLIVPVKIAEPDADGNVFHIVQAGQSLWSIAVAYQVTIDDITQWNNISRESKLQINEKLFIPGPNTEGYATPTPVGMVMTATPGPDGSIVHIVQPYNTLSTIATAYNVDVHTLLALNFWNEEWPLQIGQELLIKPSPITPTATPRPLTAVEKLTPAADGKFYHVVQSGETLSWIADLYEITLRDLERWNTLTDASVLYPDQKLLLQVTQPATITPTPLPASATPRPTQIMITPQLTPRTPTLTPVSTPDPAMNTAEAFNTTPIFIGAAGLLGILLLILGFKKPSP